MFDFMSSISYIFSTLLGKFISLPNNTRLYIKSVETIESGYHRYFMYDVFLQVQTPPSNFVSYTWVDFYRGKIKVSARSVHFTEFHCIVDTSVNHYFAFRSVPFIFINCANFDKFRSRLNLMVRCLIQDNLL